MDAVEKAAADKDTFVTPDMTDSKTKDTISIAHNDRAVWENREPYGPAGFQGLFASPYVAACAAFSALGGLLFGYDQGVVSVILVMPQFLDRFGRVSETASGAGFWKGLLTAMIELGL
jgi:hypothetical protein